jgi:hypothetical protein
MAGLDPAIHVLLPKWRIDVDARHKAGHDEPERSAAPLPVRRWTALRHARSFLAAAIASSVAQARPPRLRKLWTIAAHHNSASGPTEGVDRIGNRMMQTNMSTKDSYFTYARLSDECKKLDEVARRMKEFSRNASPFDTLDPAFQKLASEFRDQWRSVHSLSLF